MKPKIIIETLALLGNLSGIGRYTYEITKLSSKNSHFEWSFFYGYVSRKLISSQDFPSTKSLRSLVVQNKAIKAIVRKTMFFIAGVLSPRYDLYWQPNFIPTKSIRAQRIVATVHDFSWELYPEFQPTERVNHFKNNFYTQIARCDHVITGSYFTKEEIIHRTGIKAENISVIYHGIDHTLFKPSVQTNLVKQKYILAVGSLEPRKNIKNLLLAYSQCDDSFKDKYHLYLVGDKGWNNDEIFQLIEKIKKWVYLTGYISDEQLADFYRNASVFVYPSFYEGFGIPPLEAMACGTAVIVSNASTLPEVCGDAAYYVDPLDAEAIMHGMKEVLSDVILRQRLISKGLEHAQKFSWEKSALEHMAVFEMVLKK
ncbi:MAG: glycosyltransferase family 4 protein [Campylobacteraceae bacterium]|nr:glycosyltransferase family 4 protein [Campylobacteraceae bacterium]